MKVAEHYLNDNKIVLNLYKLKEKEILNKDISSKDCLLLIFGGKVLCTNKYLNTGEILHVKEKKIEISAQQDSYIGIILLPTTDDLEISNIYQRNDMINGWIVGDFEPKIIRSEEFEIAWKQEQKGYVNVIPTLERGYDDIVLVSGNISISGIQLHVGDCKRIEADKEGYLSCMQDSAYIVIRETKQKTKKVKLPTYSTICKAFNEVYAFDMIDSLNVDMSDISVVVQGPIYDQFTNLCVESVRKTLPGSEVILSTWKGMPIDGMDYDELVVSTLPNMPVGMYEDGITVKPFTHNAQILSTREGIRRASRKYILKLRSDMVLLGGKFLSYWNSISQRDKEYSLFSNRVIIANKVTIKNWGINHNYMPAPFLYSDWFYFGKADDIKMMFLTHRLMDDEEFNMPLKNPTYKDKYNFHYEARYQAEQFNIIELLKEKYSEINFSDWTDFNREIVKFSEEFLYNNFIVLDFKEYGIWMPKYPFNQIRKEKVEFYSYDDYKIRY